MRVPMFRWLIKSAVLVIACTVTIPHLAAQLQQEIAFASYRDGNWEIYRMHGNGDGQTRLTSNEAQEQYPKWSPDGSTILFVSDRDGNKEIYSMSADGSGQTNLTRNGATDDDPIWSPDGSKIAFVRQEARAKQDIWTMDPDGSNQLQITNSPGHDGHARWSPDGEWIVFMGVVGDLIQILKVRSDGRSLTQLTETGACDPDWSPDGKWIVYMDSVEGDAEICKMPADGGGRTRLTHAAGDDRHPSWSPDGTEIAFVSQRDGNKEIYSVSADGGAEKNLTNNPADDWDCEWSDDSAHILFVTLRDGPDEVYMMDRYGAGARSVSLNTGSDAYPHLGPRIAVAAQAQPLADAEAGPLGGAICFVRVFRNPWRRCIFQISPDGGNMWQMVGCGDNATDPAFSPDGRMMAYVRAEDGNQGVGLWVCNVDDTNHRRISPFVGFYRNPSWFRDSNRILVEIKPGADADAAVRDMYAVVTLNPSGWQGLPLDPLNTMIGYDASVSPVRDRIAVSQGEGATPDGFYPSHICLMDLDGSNVVRLTGGPDTQDRQPAWSADGENIVFYRRRRGIDTTEVCTVPAAGAQPHIVANEVVAVWNTGPCWSGDGRAVLFTDRKEPEDAPNFCLYWVRLADGVVRRVTDFAGWEGEADWR